MGRLVVYLITASIYVSVYASRVEREGNENVSKHNPVSKNPKGGLAGGIVSGNRSITPDGSNDSGAADDEPRKDRRALQSGDILTPPELLPLVKRLIVKVDTRKPGDGTGIVSSATSAEKLADMLFVAFFRNERRIAKLTKYDIAGLDALQALALDGEGIHKNLKLVNVDGGRCYVDILANDGAVDNNMCYTNGPGPRKSIYRLLTKSTEFDSTTKNMISIQRRRREAIAADKKIPQSRINLMNKLSKKRRLILKPSRKHGEQGTGTESKAKKIVKSSNTEDVDQINSATAHPIKDVPIRKKANLKGCRWRFECSNPRDLDTCRLKTFCPSRGKTGQVAESVKQQKALQRVRRMIGISAVDEEVEKILEARSLRLRPMDSRRTPKELPTESLTQYIHNLIRRQVFAENRNNGIDARVEYENENGVVDESDDDDENDNKDANLKDPRSRNLKFFESGISKDK